jgi:hypothetical protein
VQVFLDGYLPMHYGDQPPDAAGRDVYLLGFSFKRAVLLDLAAQAGSVTVLDHHKTAAAELTGLDEPHVLIVFDMGNSGARLTWEHFFPDKPAPWLVDDTEDRDLWLWRLEASREVSAAIASYPRTFERWSDWSLAPTPFVCGLHEEGEASERYKQKQVDLLCQHAGEVEMDGHRVLAVNTSLLISEVAGKLAEGRPFGASWFERGDGKRLWSLRSRDGGVDVAEVAKRRGGGPGGAVNWYRRAPGDP